MTSSQLHPDANAAPHAPRRAIVDCGDVETEYFRAGRGRTVIFLGGALAGGGAREALVAALATRFRVIAPQSLSVLAMAAATESGERPFTRWLLGVLDGLGIDGASLVVEGPLALDASSFAEVYAARVERIVLLGAPTAASPRLGMPILVLSDATAARVTSIMEFLDATVPGR